MYDSDVNNTATLSTSSSEMIDPDKFCFCINFAVWHKKIPNAKSSAVAHFERMSM